VIELMAYLVMIMANFHHATELFTEKHRKKRLLVRTSAKLEEVF